LEGLVWSETGSDDFLGSVVVVVEDLQFLSHGTPNMAEGLCGSVFS
jgi:hypothetical protein